ncbi:MAG: hypothetical protein QOE58_3395, partial [Actinomycetota bacterium]|nr:hypothetical protein [Actinomycetota bacterium]
MGVRVLTEAELAGWLRERGGRIVLSNGRYWRDHWGFYRLLHFTSTIPASRLSRPGPGCWAYQALLPESDAQVANSSYSVHLIRDLAAFDQRALSHNARKELGRCQANLQVVRVSDPDLLRAQGWAVFSQNAHRLNRGGNVTKDEYLAGVDALVQDTRRLILGAMDGDRLLGYITTFAVEDTAYTVDTYHSDEALSRHFSGFLPYEAAQVYRRSGLVKQLCAGVPVPERMGISDYKNRWGMPVVQLPARFWSPKPLQSLLRVARPVAYSRATG